MSRRLVHSLLPDVTFSSIFRRIFEISPEMQGLLQWLFSIFWDYFIIISLLSWEIEGQNSRIIFENKTFYGFWTFAGLTRSLSHTMFSFSES